jgi:hypothetical protein
MADIAAAKLARGNVKASCIERLAFLDGHQRLRALSDTDAVDQSRGGVTEECVGGLAFPNGRNLLRSMLDIEAAKHCRMPNEEHRSALCCAYIPICR